MLNRGGRPRGACLLDVHHRIVAGVQAGERPVDIARQVGRPASYVNSAIANLRRHGLIARKGEASRC